MPTKTIKSTRTAKATSIKQSAAETLRSVSRKPVTQSTEAYPRRTFLNLPDPEELLKYEKIIPGGAERILELAEETAAQDRALDARQLETSAKLKLLKHLITFILALGTGALGAALLLAGSELAGLLVIVIDAAVLALVALKSQS